MDVRESIAKRAVRLIEPGWTVNVGIGIPTLILSYLDVTKVFVHSENGLLGAGPPPESGEVDSNLVDAGKKPITACTGSVYFDSAQSFAMIRGGHVDAAVMGALQVDARGRIGNWTIPGLPVLGVGGAMDLMEGARTVIIVMQHVGRNGRPKILRELSAPATSMRAADVIVTELATFWIEGGRLVLKDLAPLATLAEIRAKTEAEFTIDPALPRAEPLAQEGRPRGQADR